MFGPIAWFQEETEKTGLGRRGLPSPTCADRGRPTTHILAYPHTSPTYTAYLHYLSTLPPAYTTTLSTLQPTYTTTLSIYITYLYYYTTYLHYLSTLLHYLSTFPTYTVSLPTYLQTYHTHAAMRKSNSGLGPRSRTLHAPQEQRRIKRGKERKKKKASRASQPIAKLLTTEQPLVRLPLHTAGTKHWTKVLARRAAAQLDELAWNLVWNTLRFTLAVIFYWD
jgi:hypothetical protein